MNVRSMSKNSSSICDRCETFCEDNAELGFLCFVLDNTFSVCLRYSAEALLMPRIQAKTILYVVFLLFYLLFRCNRLFTYHV